MRLLNVRQFTFQNFTETPPKYAIASHRWFDKEVTLQDIERKRNQRSEGYRKVQGFARYVREHFKDVNWIWIDTCCINKPDLSELSEAINCMYEWYRNAHVCLAYLWDVNTPKDSDDFQNSVWFKRGWTLQELLAPRTVIFLAQDWRVLGYKGSLLEQTSDPTLNGMTRLDAKIAGITGIPEEVIHNYEQSQGLTVEEKLRWMEERHTTRPEDNSYCLLGILNAKMVINYGEGRERARRRLLEDVTKDHPPRQPDGTRIAAKADLARLLIAKDATYDSSAEGDLPKCLPGTREDLLRDLMGWATDQTSKMIFWLCGKAGTGKSTISRTIAQKLDDAGQLGASFFFKRGRADRSHAGLFFPTIARQLADKFPDLRYEIAIALEDDSLLCEKHITRQFDRLLLQPMLKSRLSNAPLRGISLVIDALDECDDSEQIETILKLLKRIEDVQSARIRIFVTSRPDVSLVLGFKDMSNKLFQDVRLEEVQERIIRSDLHLFFNYEFSRIRKKYLAMNSYSSLPENWPGPDTIESLVDKSHPLFIVAFTLCRHVSRSKRPQDSLDALLSQSLSHGSLTGLAEVYLPILYQAIAAAGEQDTKDNLIALRIVIGPLIFLYDPLSATAMSSLLDIPIEDVGSIVPPLQSVLNVAEKADGTPDPLGPIKLFHLSFRDFLVDPALAKDDKGRMFWIDEAQSHNVLAESCLRLLSTGTLRKDVCQVEAPGTRRVAVSKLEIMKHLPEDVAYACCYWVHHVVKSGRPLDDDGPGYTFLKTHFLHWFEAMSWLGKASQVIHDIAMLLRIKNVSVLQRYRRLCSARRLTRII